MRTARHGSARVALGVAALVAALAAALLPPTTASAQQAADAFGAPLAPADGVPVATIERTDYGIPHVTARDWESLGFGHGLAFSEDSFCLLSDAFLSARGLRSRYLGPNTEYVDAGVANFVHDVVVRDLRSREVVEDLLAGEDGPSPAARALIDGYVAGYNAHLAGGEVSDEACAGAEWLAPVEPIDLWYLLLLSQIRASTGQFLDAIVFASPPDPAQPGSAPTAADVTADDLEVDADALRDALAFDAGTNGSNGTAVGSASAAGEGGLLLGNPHFPWLGKDRFHQSQLTIPGVVDVAGASLTGFPVVNIGWNQDVAWTHTVSTAYRFTPYVYGVNPAEPTTYSREGQLQPLDRRVVEVPTGPDTTVAEDVWSTPEGYVAEVPGAFDWTTSTVFAIRDANVEHLATLDSFLEMALAGSTDGLLAAQDRTGGIPWVNTIATDADGNATYADNSVVPNVPYDVPGCVVLESNRIPVLAGELAGSACAWQTDDDAARPGILGPSSLPRTTRTDWVVNANDSYWLPNPAEELTGFDPIIGCEACERSERTRVVYDYPAAELAADGEISLDDLQGFETANRVHAAEVARADDDLADVCEASGPPAACEALAGWDGRSDLDSTGVALFREFWARADDLPAATLWEVPFDPAEPTTTPRDLAESAPEVQQAFADAVAALDAAGVAYDAPLRELQVAADRGAAPIPIHGGSGGAGNANAISTLPLGTGGVPYAVVGGSSHIQAVAMTPDGPTARTILTYGNAEDPTSPHDDDQTALWSEERWVPWPWTVAERIARPGYRATVVTGGDTSADDVLTPLAASLDPGRSDDPTAVPPRRVDRVAGVDRVETAVEVSRRSRPAADTAVLVRSDVAADALTGGALAASLDAPLLLTHDDGVPPEVDAELARLGVTDVVVVGGSAAVPEAIVDALEDDGYAVDRVFGDDRYATAAAVADRFPDDAPAVLARGDLFPDALSATGLATALGGPVLLTVPDRLVTQARGALAGRGRVDVVGGSNAIADDVLAQLDDIAGEVARRAGVDRYATSRAVLAEVVTTTGAPALVPVATGTEFPDALASGALASQVGSSVLLSRPDEIAPATLEQLTGIDPATVLVIGGTNALSAEVEQALRP